MKRTVTLIENETGKVNCLWSGEPCNPEEKKNVCIQWRPMQLTMQFDARYLKEY